MTDDNWNEVETENWVANARQHILDYLDRQKLIHGDLGEWFAWAIPPVVSIWAVQSVIAPGSIGWWVIYGDLPTDYCSADDCRHPRLAIKKIARSWLELATNHQEGQATLGESGIPADFKTSLESRATIMLEFASDDGLWEE